LSGLHHVAITVSDLDRSAEWYSRVLDMREQFREDSPTRKAAAVYRFKDGPWSVGLVQHGEPGASGFDPTVIGLDHVAFTIGSRESMRSWAQHLDEQGVDHSGPIEVPPGEILNFKDPDGIALALFWDRDGTP
jgi:glyoxylase I family protein